VAVYIAILFLIALLLFATITPFFGRRWRGRGLTAADPGHLTLWRFSVERV
jgi:hypothetical protein